MVLVRLHKVEERLDMGGKPELQRDDAPEIRHGRIDDYTGAFRAIRQNRVHGVVREFHIVVRGSIRTW